MGSLATGNSDETDQLLQRAARGDRQGLGALLERHRKRLRSMVALRLDQRLQGRIDASDVLQEAFLEVAARLPDYLRQPPMPFFLWLRFLTGQKLLELHRHHFGAQMRDAGGRAAWVMAEVHLRGVLAGCVWTRAAVERRANSV
jgi:RNA polymerase sigma-70 factor (ECF subfamily)